MTKLVLNNYLVRRNILVSILTALKKKYFDKISDIKLSLNFCRLYTDEFFKLSLSLRSGAVVVGLLVGFPPLAGVLFPRDLQYIS
jgi:hypothetical protein